eukprot:TRINITY_DN10307_c0_g1_i1.p1 TRINITY_DN10307_c0_g1~~TRINITY_DN10307_c0_g1_i1.p1  ORF type:complete len:147 (-),score=18.20 TRINITY_DN10307_c0_g1_i1:100-540(-)
MVPIPMVLHVASLPIRTLQHQMGNDATCKTIGMGTIKIRMANGVVRTLGGVRHVPALKKNLISLGTLESKGCSLSAKDSLLKVSKGVLVLMKGTRVGNNLYKLMGNTVVGGAAVSTGDKNSVDESQLWHMRLGYMSEKGMLELHKR